MTSLTQDLEMQESLRARANEKNSLEMAEKIKRIANNIRDSSLRIRDTVRILRQSGAIDELGDAVHTASVVSRDTAKEISEAANELKESGLIKGTATAIEETTSAVRETIETVRQSAQEVKESMPQTSEALSQASKIIRKWTVKATQAK